VRSREVPASLSASAEVQVSGRPKAPTAATLDYALNGSWRTVAGANSSACSMLLRDGRMLIVLFSTVAPSAKERRSLKAIRVKIAEAIRSRPSTLLGAHGGCAPVPA
jgi:hypothetical protein